MHKQLILANPRGFCAGVNRAIDIVDLVCRMHTDKTVYVKHEIVHNQYVVQGFRKKGVIFIEELDEVPDNGLVIFSAHGVSPAVWELAKKKNLEVIDATCPLVTKVHLEAKKYSRKGYTILLIGHINHVETIGTLGEAPEHTIIIEKVEDIKKLQFTDDMPLVYLTQTTLSVLDAHDIIEAIKEKFPWVEAPSKSDICYATTNRQNAVQIMAKQVDMILVIGSTNSSNSSRLYELALSQGTQSHLIENKYGIQADWLENVTTLGLTSGASVPEVLVLDAIKMLKNQFNFNDIIELKTVEENIEFQLPKRLQNI